MSAINEQFYGQKADWINIDNARYDLFKPAWTEGSYNTTRYGSLDTLVRSSSYNPENQATVPLDSSIVPWKVNKNSKICNRHYCEVSFPNHVAGDASATDYFGQHASYKESDESALKEVNGGYRFFLARQEGLDNTSGYGQGSWNYRYSPYNYKGEFLNGTSGTGLYTSCYPIVGFNYKKTILTCVVRLVPKQYIDAPADPTSANTNENHYYQSGIGPDYGGSVIDLGSLTAQDLVDNYVVGFAFKIFSGGSAGSGSAPAGVGIGLFPFDPMNPAPASEWGVDFGSYYPYQQPYCAYTEWLATAASATDRSYSICQIGGATSQVQVALMGVDGAEPATYIAQYNETRSMRTMNTDTLEGQSASDVGNITIMYNTRKGTTENRVRAWLIPTTYNSLGVEGIKNAMKKEMAYMGFIFTDNVHDAKYVDIENHPDKYNLPIFDSNGVTTGRYIPFTDSDVENEDNYTWTTDVYERTPYNPSHDDGGGGDDGDPNTYQDGTSIAYRRPFATVGNYHYLMSAQGAKAFFKALNELISTVSQDPDAYADDMIKYFGTQDPYELIDTIMIFPRDFTYPLANYPNSTLIDPLTMTEPADYIYIGNTKIPVTGWNQHVVRVLGTEGMVNLEPFEYYDKYKNFLDYNPYSSAQIILPWCGSIDLDAQTYMGKTIQPLYYIDIQSGLCKVFLGAGESMGHIALTDTITGQVGARVQITSQDYSAQINAAIQANQIQQQQRFNQVKNAASLLTGGALAALTGTGGADVAGATVNTMFGMAQSEMAIDQANYRVETTAVPFKQVVSGTDTLSLSGTDGYAVNIFRPKFLPTYDAAEYGKQVGFATLEFGPLSNYHGYTEVETINFNGVFATEAEQEMIKSALKSGVYLP